MPVDRASATTVVEAPLETVRDLLADVARQVEWVPEITEAELLEEYEDGSPATARFVMSTRLGVDRYTLEYEPADAADAASSGPALSWTLVEGSLQKAQTGQYRLRDLGGGRTEVTLDLEVDHSISAPGFLRRKVFAAVVAGNLASLKAYLDA
jgi:ribosome-associated toxin RatA of RatAB toxin-antitoxin module